MTTLALSLLSDVSLYLGVSLGLWLSFRVLGYPDLSVENLFVLGGTLFALHVRGGWDMISLPPSLVLLAGALGFGASFLRNKLRVHPILVSLSASYLYYSTVLILLGSPNVYIGRELPPPSLSKATIVASGAFSLIVALLTLAIRTGSGIRILASGANPALARRYGLSPTLWQGVGLGIAFLLVMISGALFAWRAASIDLSHGTGLLLISIFVVVLTRAMQERIHVPTNALGIVLALTLYLGTLQVALHFGMPPQWLRGLSAASLLILVVLLPRKSSQLFHI